ncbi:MULTISPECIES: TetR/AcrR family transcriptional regulator [Bacteria]|uniref:TetR/AcrR family transcriptional regulator n=1 Tax=Bacteria TaxID=2 RepID=UPI003C7D06C8
MTPASERNGPRTRDRIVQAGAAIVQAGSERLTVRNIAARAGVGMGTLRHHFPTQRALSDAVLAAIYEEALPDERIRDTTVPAAERLLECLRHLLAPVGTGQAARESWAGIFRSFIDTTAAAESRDGYVDLHRQTMRRVGSWLAVLTEEGTLAPGDNTVRTQFLLTVVNGLALQRALPSEETTLDLENAVLRAAIDALPLTGDV